MNWLEKATNNMVLTVEEVRMAEGSADRRIDAFNGRCGCVAQRSASTNSAPATARSSAISTGKDRWPGGSTVS